MSQNNPILHPEVRTLLGIIAIAIAACYEFTFLNEGNKSILFAIGIIAFVAITKTGEGYFSIDIARALKNDNTFEKITASAFPAIMVAILMAFSIFASSYSLSKNQYRQSEQVATAKEQVKSAQDAVDKKRLELAGCNPNHLSKCVNPRTAELTALSTELIAVSQKQSSLVTEKADLVFWENTAKFFEVKVDELQFYCAIFRSVVLHIIGLYLIAQGGGKRSKPSQKTAGDSSFYADDFQQPIVEQSRETLSLNDSREIRNSRDWLNQPDESIEDSHGAKNGIIDFIFNIPDGKNMVMLGQQGYGKSSLLGHLAVEALKRGEDVYVIDPHFNITASAFPPEAKIIGKGGNYQEITQFFNKVWKEIERRKIEMATIPNASKNWRPITILMDEMTSTVEEAKLGEIFTKAFTQIRKYKGKFLGISHSLDVKSLGISGKRELLKSFEIFSLSDVTNGRVITHYSHDLDGKRIKKSVFKHPGKIEFSHFNEDSDAAILNDSQNNPHQFHEVFEEILDKEAVNKTVIFDALEEVGTPTRDIELQKQEGYTSYRKFTQFVFGEGKYGPHWNDIVDNALRGESDSLMT